MEFDADLDEEVDAPQEVEGDNSAASANVNILYGTSTTNNEENGENDIEEVDIPPNEPTKHINVDAGIRGDQNQEEQD